METGYRTKDILKISVPIMVEDVLRTLMGTVNTFTLSRVSDSASAAVGVTNQVLNVVLLVSVMLSAGVGIIENQVLGAGKERESSRIMMNSLTVAALLGVICSAVTVIFSGGLVSFMGLADELRADGETYLRIVGASCLFQFVGTMLSTHFRCHGSAVVPTVIVVISNVINFTGSSMVLNGKLGITGVRGIAIMRLLSEVLSTALLLIIFSCQKWGQKISDLFVLDGKMTRRVLSVGVMSTMERVCFIIAQMLTTRFITGLPIEVLSAKVYVQTISEYPNQFGVSIGRAAQILSGHLIGAGKQDEAHRLIRKAYFIALLFDVPGCLLCRIFANSLVGLFTSSQEVLQIAKLLLTIDIITGAARSLNHSYSFGLKSAGYVFRPMIINFFSIWLINVGLGYLCTVPLGLGIVGLWIGQSSEEWFRGLMNALQWEKKVWQTPEKTEKADSAV
ncbi:MAG: MATE family efflux transporter [Oscillospiraceae bacterium]|nr:MATE family efflux transporter [Oscillospiraceae bacterium]